MPSDAPTPLTPAVFYILLALAPGKKHGYEIMKQIERDSQGSVKMGNGTLYGSIKRMLADKLIQPAPADTTSEDDARRIYYQLTPLGRRAFDAELERYAQVVALTQKSKLLPRRAAK